MNKRAQMANKLQSSITEEKEHAAKRSNQKKYEWEKRLERADAIEGGASTDSRLHAVAKVEVTAPASPAAADQPVTPISAEPEAEAAAPASPAAADQPGASTSVAPETVVTASASPPSADQPATPDSTMRRGAVVRLLPLSLVLDHERNARHVYSSDRVLEMASAIARDDQQVPAVVMPNPDTSKPGTFLLIDGRYRKKALTSLGRDAILASIIEPLPDLDAYRLSLQLNSERNPQTTLDNAYSWRAMLDQGLYTSQDHLSEHLNIKQSTISKVLGVLDLPEKVLAVIKTQPSAFGIRVIQELRQLSKKLPEQEVEAIAEQVREEKFSVRDLERLRERASRAPVTRERSRAYSLKWDGKELGSVREFEDGRLKLDVAKVPQHLRIRIIEAVQKALADTPAEALPQ